MTDEKNLLSELIKQQEARIEFQEGNIKVLQLNLDTEKAIIASYKRQFKKMK